MKYIHFGVLAFPQGLSKCFHLNLAFNFFLPYHIDAYKAPLLIKPSVYQNLNEPPLFWTKSLLFKGFMDKMFNKPPPWNLHILINRRRFICVGMVWSIFFFICCHLHHNFGLCSEMTSPNLILKNLPNFTLPAPIGLNFESLVMVFLRVN